jgi:hypothetical protein
MISIGPTAETALRHDNGLAPVDLAMISYWRGTATQPPLATAHRQFKRL